MFGIVLLAVRLARAGSTTRLEPAPPRCQNASRADEDTMSREMSEGQRAYEERRAAKAGMSLERWLALKDRERVAENRAQTEAAKPPPRPKKPGLLSRLLDRAHRPL
jgi:hypothetical protein